MSLAAHDLRTPLATIHGFAQTLMRMGDLGEPKQKYMEMIDAASRQLAELLDELGLAARIRGGRYEPNLQPVDTLELARTAAEALGEERVHIGGPGGSVRHAVRLITTTAQSSTRSPPEKRRQSASTASASSPGGSSRSAASTASRRPRP